MTFLLNTQNAIAHLIERNLCQSEDREKAQIQEKSSKNFNLLISFSSDRHLLVKQEPLNLEGKSDGDFAREWRMHQLLETYPELRFIRQSIKEAVDFDRDRSIIVFNYLNEYCDLETFYEEKQSFSHEIAASIGTILADIHSSTLNAQQYQDFLCANNPDKIDPLLHFLSDMESITPEIFGRITKENLTFFRLYQRYESFRDAIEQLKDAYQCCCLIHNDLKLNNILLHPETIETSVRIIDWELFTWGDPGFDLGTILADYLAIWLRSLMISTDIDLNTALRLATTPLESVQPSMAALIKAYFDRFPEILALRPDFFKRVVQFMGLALLKQILIAVYCHAPFNNSQIAMLQVAKTLLCAPENSILTIFGNNLNLDRLSA
jgi:5-methylthioribose kinase